MRSAPKIVSKTVNAFIVQFIELYSTQCLLMSIGISYLAWVGLGTAAQWAIYLSLSLIVGRVCGQVFLICVCLSHCVSLCVCVRLSWYV